VQGVRQRLKARLAPPPVPAPRENTDANGGFDYNVEVCNADGLVGWVVHGSGIAGVRVLAQDRAIGQVRWGAPRADVAAARPSISGSGDSGFMVAFPDGTFATGCPQQLVVEFTAEDASVLRVAREVLPVRVPGGEPVRRGLAPSSIPADVVATLVELWPDEYDPSAPWAPEMVDRAVDQIVRILRDRSAAKPVLRYSHYLLSMSESFRFIGSHFDRINRLVESSAKDFEAVASSPEEMLCIANHLYVLRSRGATGGLVECGCFKGFSTSCLSQACAWLGMPLHVFDSFEGLPPSEGGYYKEHDFRGTMEEVTDNLRTFGQPSVVQLHRGFFADTLPHFPDPFSCIWMDVDLESSSRDVMTLLPALPTDSCVFSHECPPEAFVASVPQPDASEILPPILEAFRSIGANPVGGHLTGYLGAIWVDGQAAPVLGHHHISRIVEAAKT
jgi:O-methyltransferase